MFLEIIQSRVLNSNSIQQPHVRELSNRVFDDTRVFQFMSRDAISGRE